MSVSEKVARRVAERNEWSSYKPMTYTNLCKMLWSKKRELAFEEGIPTQQWLDDNFPVKEMDWKLLRSPKSPDIIQSTWIGHASVFVQMGNFNILSDPIFSNRCSGVQWAGPKRYRRPACTIKELMEKEHVGVDVVLVSHNHYDHLDFNSVKELANSADAQNKPIEFVVPLGLLSWFKKYVPKSLRGGNKVTELDWHESYVINRGTGTSLEVTPVPMQHWSNRRGYDRDKTLWCGYAVKVVHDNEEQKKSGANFLFTGDTGLFAGAAQIGEQYGPFDLAAIPIGAYEPRWFMKQEHMNPDDAVHFMDAVQAKMAAAIHWGTFPLTTEPVLEPKTKLMEAMEKTGKDKSSFTAPFIGETIVCEFQ